MSPLLENGPNTLTSERRLAHPLKSSWEQIERPEEIARVLERIQWAARFDVYRCAALYDLAYPGYEGDADYYLEKGKEGRVLYLGVGTGRIFAKLAEANPDAVGVDISAEMLDLLRRNHPRVRENQVLHADALGAELEPDKFDTIVAPYSFLQCFDEESATRLLKNVRTWLRPGGQFHTDTFSPYLIPFRKRGLEASVRVIENEARIAIYVLYDHVRQRMKELALIEREGEGEHVLEMDLHYYFPHELAALMKDAGLGAPTIAGGYKGEPFDPTDNEVIVYTCKKGVALNGMTDSPPYRGKGHVNGNGHANGRPLPPGRKVAS